MHAAVCCFRLTTDVTRLNLFARPLKLEYRQRPPIVYPYSRSSITFRHSPHALTCGTGGACAAIDYLVTPDSEQGCSLDVTDNDGNTAWHVAAEGGHLEAVQCLLKEGASMESTNAAGCTALHIAARCGQSLPPTCSPHRASTCPVHTFVQRV